MSSLSCCCNSPHSSSCLNTVYHSAVWHTHSPWQSSTSLDEGIKVGHYAGQFIWNITGYRKWCRVTKIHTRSIRTIPRVWNTFNVVNPPWLSWISDWGTPTVAGGHLFWICCRSTSFGDTERLPSRYGSLCLEMLVWCVTLTDGIFIYLPSQFLACFALLGCIF